MSGAGRRYLIAALAGGASSRPLSRVVIVRTCASPTGHGLTAGRFCTAGIRCGSNGTMSRRASPLRAPSSRGSAAPFATNSSMRRSPPPCAGCSITRAIGPRASPRSLGELQRNLPGRGLWRPWQALPYGLATQVRSWKQRGWVHARRPFFVMTDLPRMRIARLRARSRSDLAAGAGNSSTDRRPVRDRARRQRRDARMAPGCPPGTERAAERQFSSLDAPATRQALGSQRHRQSSGKRWTAFTRSINHGRICLCNNAGGA
jgi:hypothetical protein